MKDHLGREKAISVEQAKSILEKQSFKVIEKEKVSLIDAYGRVIAEDIFSPENLPGFIRSAMDGYAIVSKDTLGASERSPAYLKIIGEVEIGKTPKFSINRGEVAEIPTGGMLPEGADAVVMLEHTNIIEKDMIEVMKQIAPGENIIKEDEDIKKGELIFKRGHRLRPQDVAALAALGIIKVNVYRKVTVAIISTGDEIIPPEEPITSAQVRDTNTFNLIGLIRELGGIALKKGIVKDNKALLKKVVKEAIQQADIVLITGGSSVGTKDYTKDVINSLGSPGVLFHGIMIKPGKPLFVGLIDSVFVFGIPGHPAAVTVCFENFVKPVIKKLSGEKKYNYIPEKKLKAFFNRNLSSTLGREEHIRVSIKDKNGKLWAEPILGPSALIRTLVLADGIVVIPAESSGIEKGEEVEVQLF